MKDQDKTEAENQQVNEADEQNGQAAEGTTEAVEDASEQHDGAAELETLQTELQQYKELGLRIQAEADNQRKRMQRDFDKRRQFALEKFMRDLIGVRDSLERGLDASMAAGDGADDSVEQVTPLREGMQMTLKQLDKVLADHGLSIVDPQGEVFNPEQHEAVTMQPSDQQQPNTVLQVIQKGYCLHDRLLRPAMVIVAKAAE